MKVLNLVNKETSDIQFEVSSFPDGQQNLRILNFQATLDRWNKVAGVYPITIKSRLNSFRDLELIICAATSLRNLGNDKLHLYVPYFLGSRSDRQFQEGENNYLKQVICPIVNSLRFESVTVLDPHSDVLEACINNFKKQTNHNFVNWVLANHYVTHKIDTINDKAVFVSPDAGAGKKIYNLVKYLNFKGKVLVCSKDRDVQGNLTRTVVPLTSPEFFQNKDYIIIDDICDGGATFLNIAKELRPLIGKEAKIYLIVTHGIFSKGFDELFKEFDNIYCTNSYCDITNSQVLERNKIKQLNVF